jgi:kinesin family protein 11
MQKTLDHTAKLLSNTEEELMRCRYALKEKDFIISEQKKAGIYVFFISRD